MVKSINKKDLMRRVLRQIGILFAEVLAGMTGFFIGLMLRGAMYLMEF